MVRVTIFMDKLVHGIAMDGTIRLMAAITTQTVAEAAGKYQTFSNRHCRAWTHSDGHSFIRIRPKTLIG